MKNQQPGRKPLPSASGSQDGGYGLLRDSQQGQTAATHLRIGSNGPSIHGFPVSLASQGKLQDPNGKALLEGYHGDIMNNFEGESPRFNPLNPTRTNSSMLLNVDDPIQIHLLVETALGDAMEYELLSPEEVDDLKKQCRSLTQRIEQTKHNLAVQSKYCEAATTMSKLYSPTTNDGEGKIHRLSAALHRNSHHEQIREADMERQVSEKKCEELAQELWGLEKRLSGPQTRLLKHTAGILQMTHKPPTRRHKSNMPSGQGIPGSPESMYMYTNGRTSIEPAHDEDVFDDRSLYRTFDRLDGLGLGDGHSDNSKGHTRQTSRSPNKSRDLGADALRFKEEAARSKVQIASTEEKLGQLNDYLREVIIRSNPQRDEEYSMPPHISSGEATAEPGKLLHSHLEYLEQGISVIGEEQMLAPKEHGESDGDTEEAIEELNRQVHTLLLPFDSSVPVPPQLTGRSLQEQLGYLQSSINVVENELQRASSASAELKTKLQRATSITSKDLDTSQSDNHSNMQTVLEGLWGVIQSGEQDDRRQRQERRQTRMERGEELEDDDDDIDFPLEPFSLPAFSTKVRWLYGQATRLKGQQEVLQRQIKQQRELNNKSDETKDREMVEMQTELQSTQVTLEKAESQAQDLQSQLMTVMEQLDKSRRDSSLRTQDKSMKDDESADLRDALLERSEEIERLEDELQEFKMDRGVDTAEMQSQLADSEERVSALGKALAKAETRIADLTAELQEVRKSAQLLQEKEEQLDSETEVLLRDKEKEMEKLSTMLQEKAELVESSTILLRSKEQEIEKLSKLAQEKEQQLDSSTTVLLHGKEQEMERLAKLLQETEEELASSTVLLRDKEKEMETLSKLVEGKEAEMDDKNINIARLQTEVTIARAELDGAYGSRAQRAAEVAANPAVQREIDELIHSNQKLSSEIETLRHSGGGSETRIEELKRELGETIEEYEVMTKASIEWERERENLEKEIDRLRDDREGLEAKLGDERVRWLGVKSPGPDGAGGHGAVGAGNTSTAVLKTEFKKMMRDTRAENAKVLRAEQAERRRIEDELRALKKSHGPGKSSLSQSTLGS